MRELVARRIEVEVLERLKESIPPTTVEGLCRVKMLWSDYIHYGEGTNCRYKRHLIVFSDASDGSHWVVAWHQPIDGQKMKPFLPVGDTTEVLCYKVERVEHITEEWVRVRA